MTKTGKLAGWLGLLFVLLSAGVRGQTPSPYILTAPTTDQTIQQGNNALILGGQGILRFGDTSDVGLSVQNTGGCCDSFSGNVYGLISWQGNLLSVDQYPGDGRGVLQAYGLQLGQPSNGVSVYPSEDFLLNANIYFASSGGQVVSIPGGGFNYWSVQEYNLNNTYTLMCATTAQDWVGIGSSYQYGCVPYDEFDVNNQVQIGDNNSGAFAHIHFTSPAIAGTLYSNQNPAYYQNQQNAGITNCANGTLCLDGSTDGDGKAALKAGTITLAPVSAGSAGSITFPDGSVQAVAWNGTTLGGDYAESIDVQGERADYEPGDVIAIDGSSPGKFLKSANPYSRLVAGVYSTKPGLVGRRTTFARIDKAAEVPMAMMGIAPTKVTTENGPIETGDLLVTSSKPGYAMKATDPSRTMGAVIGKALAPLKSGSGVIEVLISLQ